MSTAALHFRLFMCLLALGWLSGCAGAERDGGGGFEVEQLDGSRAILRTDAATKAWVFIFLGVECPIANRCLPELAALAKEFEPGGIRFVFVYPNADETPANIRRHQADYALDREVFRDPGLSLARRLGARVTPEAVLLAADGRSIYRGRINDQYLALGQGKPAPTHHDLAEALAQFRAGSPPSGLVRPAVGCTFRPPP